MSITPNPVQAQKQPSLTRKDWSESTLLAIRVELKQQCGSNLIISLVGNKVDLESEREVDRVVALQYANENSLLHIETSAKANINVEALFKEVGKLLVNGRARDTRGGNGMGAYATPAGDRGVRLEAQTKKKSGGCC